MIINAYRAVKLFQDVYNVLVIFNVMHVKDKDLIQIQILLIINVYAINHIIWIKINVLYVKIH